MRDRRDELAAAARAAEVAPALTEAERTGRVLARARAHEEQARRQAAEQAQRQAAAAFGADEAPSAASGASAAELRAAGQEQVTLLGRLEALRSVSRQADDEDQAAGAARVSAAALAAQVDATAAGLADSNGSGPG